MCGIVGVHNLRNEAAVPEALLKQMLAMLRHRGPDEFGIYLDYRTGMGSARLSIIDLAGGSQPIGNEDGSVWIVFNGEIFNYLELRVDLEKRGHLFETNSDTEVIVHLYEEYGPDSLAYLNGQFAFAIWDDHRKRLFLARDRMGIRPLYYAVRDSQLIFGSEVKAMLPHPALDARIDPESLRQTFTYWSVLPPKTIFEDVYTLPPAHYMLVEDGEITTEAYWHPEYQDGDAAFASDEAYLKAFVELLVDATMIRLRADVPVGAYLSGGLDSSTTTAIIKNYTDNRLETFSISFANPAYDESAYQRQMADFLGTEHHIVHCKHSDIGRVFPEVIWHTEAPILRTSPAPMFLLSGLAHDNGLKVVMTGEGADEMLGGYNIFREMMVRRFWAKDPDSEMRPLLLRRLYRDIGQMDSANEAFLRGFFKRGLTETDSPFYSHLIRWENTARLRRFLVGQAGDGAGDWKRLSLPPEFSGWSALAQAQYLEVLTFMSPYLLSSQGDRVAMAHSVEGRYPFLDHRVVEFSNKLPARLKLRGLKEKWILKRLGSKLIPDEIWERPKRPYRAPVQDSFIGDYRAEYLDEMLGEHALKAAGLFEVEPVQRLLRKADSGRRLSETDEMALVGVLSAQLVQHFFVNNFAARMNTLHESDRIKIVRRTAEEQIYE